MHLRSLASAPLCAVFALGTLSCWSGPKAKVSGDEGAERAPVEHEVQVVGLEDGYEKVVLPFFDLHCVDCHGGRKPKAGLRIADVADDFSNRATLDQWAEILDLLNSHEMPPEDEPQPEPDEVARVVDWITHRMAEAELERRDTSTVLRRLNRQEYQRTIFDLTGVNFDVGGFPMDASAGGFDNIGSALTFSPLQLELMVKAAQDILDRALVQGPRPPQRKWRFEAESADSQPYRYTPDGMRWIVRNGVGETRGQFRILRSASWDRTVAVRDFNLPAEGVYRVRVHAGGISPNREQVVATAEPLLKQRLDERDEKDPKHIKAHRFEYDRDLSHFRTDRMFDYGPPRLQVTQLLGGQPQIVGEFDVLGSPDQPRTVELEVYFSKERAALEFDYAYRIPGTLENFRVQHKDTFARPEVLLDWVEIEGPIYESWPPPSQQLILGDLKSVSDPQPEQVEQLLKRFMARAYRRPVTEAEVAGKMALYKSARGHGRSFVDAIKVPLTAVLVSPDFLYMVEGRGRAEAEAKQEVALTSHELATRLAYFLWSTMPDETLFELAASDRLKEPEVLLSQVERLLADERSEGLVTNFAGQWLGLREVGENPPVPELYPRYDAHLEESIVREGEAFFGEVLRKDLGVMNFVQSDFVVINERLGRFYGIPGVKGDGFRRVPVPAGVPRGGVLTQAAMHSITSNGTRTSPVKRGAWVMKNLLGQDPGVPVANAGEIAPKVPGIDRATVRQRLQIHRELPQCARCHDKMDPLGFALENFNAAGEWRTQEGFGYRGRTRPGDPPIDASGELPDGAKFEGVTGLQKLLLERRGLFLSCLTEKLLTYALGRELTGRDRGQIQVIVDDLGDGDVTLKGLIRGIVASDRFRHK